MMIRSVAVGVADQSVYAASNLVGTLVAAKLLGRDQFGEYAIILSAAILVTGASRAIVGETLAFQGNETRWQLAGGAVGAAFILGVVAAVLGGVVAHCIAGQMYAVTWAIAALSVITNEGARQLAFVLERPAVALAGDIFWFLTQGVASVVVLATESSSVTGLIMVWALPALAATAGMLATLHVALSLRDGIRYLATHLALGLMFLVEYASGSGVGHLIVLVAGWLVSPSAAGTLRAVVALYGPVAMLALGIRSAIAHRVVAMARAYRWHDFLLINYIHGYFILVVACISVVLLLETPVSVGTRLLSEQWGPAVALCLPFGLYRAFSAVSYAVALGVRALGGVKFAALLRPAAGIASLAGAYVMGAQHELRGMVVALAVISAVEAVTLSSWLVATWLGRSRLMTEASA